MGTLHEDVFTFMTVSQWILLRMRNLSNKFVEKMKTHFIFNNFFFRKSRCLWDNVEKRGGAREATNDVTVWRRRVACWISKPTRTQTPTHPVTLTHKHALTQICNIYCFSAATMVTRTRLSVKSSGHWRLVLFISYFSIFSKVQVCKSTNLY